MVSRRLSSSQKQAQVLRRRVALLEEKANPMYAGYTAISEMPQARTMPKNYKTFATEGFTNDTIYKAIMYGIQNGAAIPPKLFTDRTMQKEITSHPLLEQMDNPNPEQDGVFFRESVLGYYLISGNSFIYAIKVNKNGPPDELWTLEPDKVKPIPDEKRGIVGYQVDYFPKERNPVDPALIGHMRTWNPKDPYFGLSPMEVASIIVDQQSAIRKWNLALLQNFAKPPGAWVTDTLLSPNDRQKLEARVNEKLVGYRNAGKTPVLDGALKWQPSAVSPGELDWLQSVQYNAGQIANIYNMAPQLIGDTSATTYNNMEEAKAASYTEFIFPMLDKFYSVLNRWLLPMYPDLKNAYLYYDKETVEVVQNVIQARLTASTTRANQSWMQGSITMNESREIQGLPPVDGGDVFRFGAVLVRTEDLDDYAEQSLSEPAAPPMPQPEPLNVDPTQPPSQEKPDAHNNPDNNSNKPANKPTGKQPDSGKNNEEGGKRRVLRSTKALDLSTTEEKRAYADSIENARKKHEDTYEAELKSHFDEERKAVVKAITSSVSRSQHILAARAEGALNDQQSSLKTVLMDLYKDVAVDIGGNVAAQLSNKKGAVSEFIQLFGDKQLKYLLQVAGAKITQINATTLQKIRKELAAGVEAGESIPQIAARIDTLYLEQIVPNRSTLIARTECVGSSNWAAIQAAQSSGLTLNKVWLATGDNRTRIAHQDADGQEVGINDTFEVGGEQLDFPGDPSGSAGNIDNCRCTVYFTQTQANGTEIDLGTDDTLESELEKRIKREAYRKFMDEVLV